MKSCGQKLHLAQKGPAAAPEPPSPIRKKEALEGPVHLLSQLCTTQSLLPPICANIKTDLTLKGTVKKGWGEMG